MNKWLFILLPMCLIALVQLPPQTIRGRVLDSVDSMRLPGVRIAVVGQSAFATTDAAGQFTLSVTKLPAILTVSYIGYVRQKITVTSTRKPLQIRLVADTTPLREVVLSATEMSAVSSEVRTGYGVSSRMSADKAAPMALRASTSTGIIYRQPNPDQQAGQLTAGEIHDYSKWTLWGDITQQELGKYRALWQQAPAERYSVQVVSADGFPMIDVPVRLLNQNRQLVWEARTDNTGRAELWARLFRQAGPDSAGVRSEKLNAEAVVMGKVFALNRIRPFGQGDNTLTVAQPCGGAQSAVDVAFVVDATGSMGDEIAYLKAELTDVIGRAKAAAPGSTIRLGSVFYRDHSDTYLTRHHDFSAQPDSAVAFIKKQSAAGGGDYPEAVDTALSVALTKLTWSPTAKARLLFLVLDAPPHDNPASVASLQRSVARAAAMGIRLIPIAASGIDKSTEYLLRAMALGTNGTYVFLTDDSGIGNPHIKPTTDQYTVEKLNALLVRLITKFMQTPNCHPQPTVSVVPPNQVRYTEEGKPVEVTPSFRCFPNPTRDYLTVENSRAIDELYVMDITGKVLLRETPNRPTVRLDMQPYPTGTYLFRFNASQQWQAGRFVLNR